MNKPKEYAPEVRSGRADVFDHEREYDSQWAAIRSISEKIACTVETLPVRNCRKRRR